MLPMMTHQRWLWIGLVLLCCISASQQLFDKLKSTAKEGKYLIVDGITNVADGALNTKNGITDTLNDVSPHILGPIAEKLDPEWLTGMNYTMWVRDMQSALKNGSTTEWCNTVGKMLDLDRVIDEVKTSTATKATCLACKFGVNLGRSLMAAGSSDKDIVDLAAQFCTLFKIQSERVCRGVMDLIGVDVVQIIRESDMRPAQICSFIFGNSCLNGYDARHDWKVSLPGNKQGQHLTEAPPRNAKKFKVLQISDTHYDPYYEVGSNADCGEPLCCRAGSGEPANDAARAGKWGDYRKCDTPRWLLHNTLKQIADTHKDIDYIMWTGDLPPHDVWSQTKEENLANLMYNAKIMSEYFEGIPVYASVGNHESCPVDSFAPPSAPPRKNMSWLYNELDRQWGRWLPSETSSTIRRGAFYSVLVKPGFRILSINGNYCSKNNFWLLKNSNDPVGELAWMTQQLEEAEKNGEKVHVIGHVPPGGADCLKVWSQNYYDIINRFEETIMAQFFGHTHFDELEIFYDTKDFKRPLSVGYISPSITPWEDVNPSYRIYHVDEMTKAIVDHETWMMDLDEANRNDKPVWRKLYTATEAYNMTSLLPKDWDDFLNRMNKDKNLFEVYHKNYYRDTPVRPKCDDSCRKKLLCDVRSGRSYDRQNLCHFL